MMENKEIRNEIPMELEDEILEEVAGGLDGRVMALNQTGVTMGVTQGQSAANTANIASKAGSEGQRSCLTVRIYQRDILQRQG